MSARHGTHGRLAIIASNEKKELKVVVVGDSRQSHVPSGAPSGLAADAGDMTEPSVNIIAVIVW